MVMMSTHILNWLCVWAAPTRTTDLERIKSEVFVCRLEYFLWLFWVRGCITWLLFVIIIRTPRDIAYTFQIIVMRRRAKINLAILWYEHSSIIFLHRRLFNCLLIVPYYVLEKWRGIAAHSAVFAAFQAELWGTIYAACPVIGKVKVLLNLVTLWCTFLSQNSIAMSGALTEAHVWRMKVVGVEGIFPLELVVVLGVNWLALAELLLVLKLQILLVVGLDWML